MKKLLDLFRPNKKHYTYKRGNGKTIVLNGDKWVYSMKFELTDDLKGNTNDFFKALKDKDFYMEDVHWGGRNQKSRILRFHGPFPIEEISEDSYISVEVDKAVSLLERTLNNPDFHNDFPFNQEYKNEAKELLEKSLTDKSEI